jgi:hypothetical protein
MREKLKKIKTYIFRSWEGEVNKPHPKLQILPPIFFDLLGSGILLLLLLEGIFILYEIIF